ncbi:MAG: tRNA (uridine(34)/cytosine(34)/5-carboxymethylaminomethyluridine(34)-2'-O)-methyltransferase TrmL [Planctomyces sp.]|nr:tRNA (uridine(34)/cytosine(34)/5-carboxymethylaminomethyluridine(34)-2'-O)-methyltransferase TrmL [Planctomyces sp.]
MTKPLLNIVLHEPEIPQNTGNIGRTCVAVGAKLWLIEPIGYSLDDKYLRRAGMDYWQYLDYQVVGSWEEARQLIQPKNIWYLTKKATKLLWEASFEPGDVLLFGSESKGLPPEIRDEQPEHNLRLPTTDLVRSLNLASTVNTTVYEAVRQFGGLPE